MSGTNTVNTDQEDAGLILTHSFDLLQELTLL